MIDVSSISKLGKWIVKENDILYWASHNGIICEATNIEALLYLQNFVLWDVAADLKVMRDKLYEKQEEKGL